MSTKKNPFTRAREAKSWSFTGAANHMEGVSEQQLRNLEGISATRDTDPGHVRIATALEIIRAYWPDVSLADFVPDTVLSTKPRDAAARRKLKGYHS